MESMEVKKEKLRMDSPLELTHRYRPCAARGRLELALPIWSQCLSSPSWDIEEEEMGHVEGTGREKDWGRQLIDD
jgi:hypothetical protein